MKDSVAYQRGYDAYLGPMKGKTNPYVEGTLEHSNWNAGFNAAQADYSW